MVGIFDHQVNIERQARVARGRFHKGRTEGNVVHKMAIHHIAVNPIRAGLGDAFHLRTEAAEVTG